MKKYTSIFKYYLLLTLTLVCISGCQNFLDKTDEADLLEEDVFSTFIPFEGFIEEIYTDVIDKKACGYNSDHDLSDFAQASSSTGGRTFADDGDYWNPPTGWYNTGAYTAGTYSQYKALWQSSWMGIRKANIAIAHLKDLVEATDEEKQFIEGQAYFFRAYFHWEIMRVWGSIPYIDTVLSPVDDMKFSILSFQQTAEKVVEDLQKAADLLPSDWDNTVVGSKTSGVNFCKATKGAAYSFMAECLLFSGSPLMNGVSTGNYSFNTDYCKRAAEAAWKVIELANQGFYALEPWDKYKDIFAKFDKTTPRSKEVVFVVSPYDTRLNVTLGDRYYDVLFVMARLGGESQQVCPTQNLVDEFEMTNGLPQSDPASGYNPMNPWNNLDPRFTFNILKDQDRVIVKYNDQRAFAQYYVGGGDRSWSECPTGYGFKKYWNERLNTYDGGLSYSGNFRYFIPRIRLAEIYLFYAEAVNEAYGPNGQHPGSALSAIDAVNIVKTRANMPGVNAKFTGSKEAFRERIWCERSVELCFEMKRWFDIRRWYVAHLDKYKEKYELQFPKDHSYFNRVMYKKRVFELKHYWVPFPVNQVTLYPGWKQNSGW